MNCFSVEINIFLSKGHDFCRSNSAFQAGLTVAGQCGQLKTEGIQVVDEVRHPQITEFVSGYDISLRTRQGDLTDVRSFFSW